MKRHKLPPDKRLDWRNPDMPVMMMGNRFGEPENAKPHMLVIEPKEMQELAQWQMRNVMTTYWKDDPSYNWGKKRK